MSPSPPPTETDQPSRTKRPVIDNVWAVLAILFLVTLFLGLPLLWFSRAFTVSAKMTVTVLVLLWSAVVFYLFWLVMWWSVTRIREAWTAW